MLFPGSLPLSPEKLKVLDLQLFQENMQRCKLFAKIVILFEAILIVMNLASRQNPFSYNFYLMMYFILLFAAMMMLWFIHRYEKDHKEDRKLPFYRIGLLVFVCFFLIWGAVVSLADQLQYGNVMAFAVNIMSVSILFHASNKTILQLYGPPIVILYIGLPFFQTSHAILVGHYINLTVFLVFCWIASRMLYTNYCTNFYHKMLITETNKNLALKIKENEKMNRKLAEINKQLKQLTMIDELTKIPNRRGLQETINHVLEQTKGIRRLTFIMIDIDEFKRLNDYYGHFEGDKILQAVAQKINSLIDTVARFGGEEFIISIFDISEQDALQLAEKIRLAVFHMKIPHEASSIAEYVTISLGLAAGYVRSTLDVDNLMQKADHALYRAKSLGRNRVEIEEEINV